MANLKDLIVTGSARVVGKIYGTVTKAIADSSGNNIESTYVKKSDYLGFNLFDTKKFKQCDFVRGGNSVDKTRPNYIGCNSIDDLKSLLKVVLANNEKIALVK